ncbi:MAG: lipoyl synthase [Candidatus Omnitrophica bacterium]|nr:lipoyl synthase [Candidatus Omnitrophota bacterium]
MKLPLQKIPEKKVLQDLRNFRLQGIHTVCQEAKCPNLGSCFLENKLAFLILGDICTRNCSFCAVKRAKQEKLPLDQTEPVRIAQAVKNLGLKFVVLTSVTRDDLADGGAANFALTIELIHALGPGIKVEVLIPDFQGKRESLEVVLGAQPEVVAHNLETVPRLYGDLRPMASYALSLELLGKIKEISPITKTKSSLMLGLGEKEEEVINVMKDLRKNHCDFLTLGQYLAPSISHYPVKEFIALDQFDYYRSIGLSLGFRAVLSAPLVRSSYKAEELYGSI